MDYFKIDVTPEAPWASVGTSGNLDTIGVLTRQGPDGVLQEILRADHGGEAGNFSLLTKLDPGTYFVRVESYGSNVGVYSIRFYSASELGKLTVPSELQDESEEAFLGEATAIGMDEERTGALTGDLIHPESGRPIEVWKLRGEVGTTVYVDLVANSFDSYLYAMGEGMEELTAEAWYSNRTRLELTIPISGEVMLLASASDADARGDYRLRVSTLQGVLGEATTIGVDEERTGSLTGDLIHPESGRPIEVWKLSGEVGTTVYVDLVANSFDSYLYAMGEEMDELTADDHGESSHARLELTIPISGEVTLLASAYDADGRGDYQLRVSTLQGVLGEATTIGVDEERTGSLTGDLIHPESGRPIEVWKLSGEVGTMVYVDLVANSFDSYLYAMVEGMDELTADDHGESSHARLELTIPIGGEVTLLASAYDADGRGDYQLRVSTLQGVLGEATTIGVDEERTGSLTGDLIHPESGRPIEVWKLSGEVGTTVYVDLVANSFDSYLYAMGEEMDELTADDHGESSHARLELTIPISGEVTLLASAYDADGRGDYQLRVSTDPQPWVQFIDSDGLHGLGQPVAGLFLGSELFGNPKDDDDVISHGYAQVFTYEGTAGEEVSLELVSEEFDSYLYLIGPANGVVSDDDGADGLNSRIQITLPESGTYRIVASSLYNGTGAFKLRVLRPIRYEQ